MNDFANKVKYLNDSSLKELLPLFEATEDYESCAIIRDEILLRDKHKISNCSIWVGARVHLHSMNGMYIVDEIWDTGFTITCGIWKAEGRTTKFVPWSDLKCLAGGFNNAYTKPK